MNTWTVTINGAGVTLAAGTAPIAIRKAISFLGKNKPLGFYRVLPNQGKQFVVMVQNHGKEAKA